MVTNTKEGLLTGFVPTSDKTWRIVQEGYDPYEEHDMETIFTVGNGFLGIRGTAECISRNSRPGMFVAGLFGPDKHNQLPQMVVCPHPFAIRVAVEGQDYSSEDLAPEDHFRILDLQQGVLFRNWIVEDSEGRRTRFHSQRSASMTNRRALFQQIEVQPLNYSGEISIDFNIPGRSQNMGRHEILVRLGGEALEAGGTLSRFETRDRRRQLFIGSRTLPCTGHPDLFVHEAHGGDADIGASDRWSWSAAIGETYTFTRMISVATTRETEEPDATVISDLDLWAGSLPPDSFHNVPGSWRELWEISDVVLEGDPTIQQALRFYIYHMLISANPNDERVSIGARTLSGEAYNGHVFWDTETYMLPFYVATQPAMARALMMYRYHTLDGARRKAAAHGCKGAFYAWESAETGDEVTPEQIIMEDNRVIPIHTGHLQVHITADVAHGARRYWHATGDESFIRDAGTEIMLETARFWRSRAELGDDGLYHLNDLQGPDEYHIHISDNAYTNYMASWNVIRALGTLDWLRSHHPAEAASLLDKIAMDQDEIEDLQDFVTRIYSADDPQAPAIEQFRGYFELDSSTVEELGRKDGPLSVTLDEELLQKTQVLKQADTLLLFQLFPELACKSGFKRNFDYYEPRTDHGSSLSYPTHALLAARLGYTEKALNYLALTAGLDLDDVMGNAALGIHAATAGGLWQAVIFGFAGLQYTDSGITVDPHMPAHWNRLAFTVLQNGKPIKVEVTNNPLKWEIL